MSRPARFAAPVLLALSCFGCISLVDPGIDPDSPVYLRAASRDLDGASMNDLLVRADETLLQAPLDTGLIRRVSEEARDGVVSIYAQTKTPARVRLLPFGPGFRVRLPGVGLGSGFFIHSSGYILTNNHVIRDAAQIRVQTRSGADYGVVVVARDPVYDLALLKIQGTDREFSPLPMGESKEIGVGDHVIAIGNPLGLGHTATSGIISQTGRNLAQLMDPDMKEVAGRTALFVQTDTPINPGSSGGPLITLSGAWVAVNTAGIPDAQNIGFAVPAAQVLEFLEDVLEGEGEIENG